MAHALACPVPLSPLACGVVGSGGLGGLGGSIVAAFFSSMATWFADTAVALIGHVGALLGRSTTPPVTAPWFAARQRVVLTAAAPLALLALVAGALHALVRGTVGELARTVLLRLPVAFLLGAAGAGLVGLAVSATDQLSASLAGGAGASLTTSLRGLALSVQLAAPIGDPLALLVTGLVIVGGLALWVELVVRAAAITIATALLPLVLAASLWPPAAAWVRRLAETLGALIVSKAVIVLVLALALDAVAHAGDGASSVLTGGAMLLLASFMPFAVLRLVPAVEAAAVSHLEGVRHRAVGAARQHGARAVSLALAGAGGAAAPGIDAAGASPVGMLPGLDVDLVAGTPLDPSARFVRGAPPYAAVPASAGTHVWERDHIGPQLVWKPPGHVDPR